MAGSRHQSGPERFRESYGLLRRNWPQFQALVDATVWAVSVPLAAALRFDFDLADQPFPELAAVTVGSAAAFTALGYVSGLYRRRFRYASFDELLTLAATTVAVSALMLLAVVTLDPRPVPLSIPFIAGALSLLGLTGARYAGRRLLHELSRPDDGATPVLVYGAGHAGTQLVASMQRNPRGHYRPVGLLDDHPAKSKLTVDGVRVLGGRHQLAAAAERTGADLVILAMPSADGPTIRELVELSTEAGLQVKTLPTLHEMVSPIIDADDIRPVTEADLLGRRQIETDVAAIAGYVRGKRLLVTGAGGSIGSELCRQLHRFEPEAMIMVDRDESALHGVQLSIDGRGLLDNPNLVVADIRDHERMVEVFQQYRPNVVFHAAALKHLPLLEMHPAEGVKTNVWGTQHVLSAALASGVDRFVNISTDKAANPTSVLGRTKRLAERLTAHAAQEAGRPYLSVRFGNVLGSRGSVVPAFQSMIDAGRPITVTHPDVTRYFMTVPEAVQLVIQAGAIGSPGEVLILDMGEPVRIVDIARRLIRANGSNTEIVFTGLRPGEKLHEDLVSTDEIGARLRHPLITHAQVDPIDPIVVRAQCTNAGHLLGAAAAVAIAAADGATERPRAS